MPRTTTIEEKMLESELMWLQKKTAFQTGLVVGQIGSKTDTVLHLAPTPEQDGKASAVDANWMANHAKQVAQMLPGGIAVLGCYVFAPGAKLTKSEATLTPMLATLAKRLDASIPDRQAVLLLLPSDAKKATCKALPAAATAKLQPLELKLDKAPAQVRVCV